MRAYGRLAVRKRGPDWKGSAGAVTGREACLFPSPSLLPQLPDHHDVNSFLGLCYAISTLEPGLNPLKT